MSFYSWVVVVCLVSCSHIDTVLSGLPLVDPCPNGAKYNFDDDNGKCFVVRQKLVSRNIGERNCENMGGVLAITDDDKEQTFINYMTTEYSSYWIGPTDQYNSRGYLNPDGSNLSYSNWEDGQPDDDVNLNDQRCVQLTEKKWHDDDCNSRRDYICQLIQPRNLLQLTFKNLGESQFIDGEVWTRHSTISRIKCQVLCVSHPVCIGYMWISAVKINNCRLILPLIGNSLDVYPGEMIYEVVER